MTSNFARAGVTTLAALGLAFAGATAHAQTVITGWDFNNDANNVASTPSSSPAASTGTGTASTLGMTNNYIFTTTGSKPKTYGPSQDASDILNTSQALDPTSYAADEGSSDTIQNATNSNVWRIRGGVTATSTNANGWSSQAPQYTQGAQFSTSTVGFTNIGLTFDWLPTTQGVGDLQVQYTTDGTTFTNIGSVISAVNGTNLNNLGTKGSGWYNGNTVDFSAIDAVNNDANFGIRLVSAYDANTPGAYTNTLGAPLNNTSGNWRFDEVNFTGTSATVAPEPSQAAGLTFFLLGVSALAYRARKRANAAG